MPDYPWMLTSRIDYDYLPSVMGALRTVGLPYSDDEVENAPALARAPAWVVMRAPSFSLALSI